MCLCPPGYGGYCCEIRELFSRKKSDFFHRYFTTIGMDPCSPNPCQNNGVCTASGSSYVCTCLNGFSGQFCQIRKYLWQVFKLIFL
jgi:Notch-like protein